MWESQEIKEIGFPKGQSSVLVCKEDEVRVWSGGEGIQCLEPPLAYTLTGEANANSSRESQAGFGRPRSQ